MLAIPYLQQQIEEFDTNCGVQCGLVLTGDGAMLSLNQRKCPPNTLIKNAHERPISTLHEAKTDIEGGEGGIGIGIPRHKKTEAAYRIQEILEAADPIVYTAEVVHRNDLRAVTALCQKHMVYKSTQGKMLRGGFFRTLITKDKSVVQVIFQEEPALNLFVRGFEGTLDEVLNKGLASQSLFRSLPPEYELFDGIPRFNASGKQISAGEFAPLEFDAYKVHTDSPRGLPPPKWVRKKTEVILGETEKFLGKISNMEK